MKKLPPPKINPAKFLPSSSSALAVRSIQNKSNVASENNLVVIRTRVIEVKKLIQNHTLLKRKEDDTKRIKDEEKKNKKKELELEKKPGLKEGGKFKVPSLPKLGFLDRIKNFFINVLLGYIAVRLVPYVNKFPKIVSGISTGIDFATDVFIKMFDRLTTFVQKGYEAYDFTRKQLKNLGGDNAVRLFDGFNNALEGVITAALAASFALVDMVDGPDTPSRRGGTTGSSGPYKYDRQRALIRKKYGDSAARIYDIEKLKGKNSKQITDIIESRYIRKGRIIPQRMVGSLGGTETGSNILGRGIQNAPKRLAIKGLAAILGKSGARAVLSSLSPLVANVPLIGGIMEFVLSWLLLGDSIGKAAFKGTGTSLGMWLGGALGALIGGPIGAGVGMWIGGEGGSKLGEILYDKIFTNKDPNQSPKPKVQNRAQGGAVIRGGKLVGGPTRRTAPKKSKRSLKVQVTKVKPGSSVGGKDKIEKIFPERGTKEKTGTVNPLGYMKSSYDRFSSTPGLGGIFAIALKAQLGEKPSDLDYQNAAEGLTGWMQRSLSSEIMRTGGAFAGGGEVNMGMFSDPDDMKNMIAKSIQNTVTPKINDTINDLMKELMLKEPEGKGKEKEQPTPGAEETGGQYSPEGLQGEIYKYLLSKGLDDNKALGIMANISRESGFRPGVSQTGGPGVGLFQYSSSGRKDAFLKAVPDYATNWKGQIDFALKDDVAPQYLQMQFSSPQEAADWWMKKWERPAEDIQNIEGPRIHREYLASLEKFRTKQGYKIPTFSDASIGKGIGNLNLAKQLAESMGVRLYSHVRKDNPDSYHYDGRAMDFSNDAVGNGTPQQLALAKELVKRYGATAKEIIYTPLGFSIKNGKRVAPLAASGHYNHVHVAFATGGRVTNPTYAMLGEKGPEFVFDADTTKGLDTLTPGLLEQLNIAKTKPQIASILQFYADYEEGGEQVVEVVSPEPQIIPMMMPVPMGGGMSGGISASDNSSYDTLYHGH